MGKVKEIIDVIRTWDDEHEDKFLVKMDKAGYLTEFHQVDHDKMSKDRIWATKDGALIPYVKLTDDHLNRIIGLFNDGKFRNREQHYIGLSHEYFSRISVAGEVLFGTK